MSIKWKIANSETFDKHNCYLEFFRERCSELNPIQWRWYGSVRDILFNVMSLSLRVHRRRLSLPLFGPVCAAIDAVHWLEINCDLCIGRSLHEIHFKPPRSKFSYNTFFFYPETTWKIVYMTALEMAKNQRHTDETKKISSNNFYSSQFCRCFCNR